jgi:hypothetical protein
VAAGFRHSEDGEVSLSEVLDSKWLRPGRAGAQQAIPRAGGPRAPVAAPRRGGLGGLVGVVDDELSRLLNGKAGTLLESQGFAAIRQ